MSYHYMGLGHNPMSPPQTPPQTRPAHLYLGHWMHPKATQQQLGTWNGYHRMDYHPGRPN